MNISKGSIANLLVVWCFAMLLGITVGMNVPFVLLIVATLIYLIH
jgi:hypothetical protein